MPIPADAAAADAHRTPEEQLIAGAPGYDLAALVIALRGLGYPDEAIEFRSNHSAVRQTTVVDSLEFRAPPQRGAVITVNLSLLGPQSPLPAYFQKVLAQQADSSLAAFLNFFSHRLVRSDIAGMFPERDPRLFPDFTRTKRQLLSLLGLRSPSTLHWLFQAVFPELEVAVRRTVLQRPVHTRGMVIGQWSLGDGSVFGGLATAPVSAVGVTLFCDDPLTLEGEPWAHAADHRLRDRLLPRLAAHGLFLEIALVLRDQSTFLILAPQQFLGYEPLYSGEDPPVGRTSRTIILFSGEVRAP